MSLKKFVTIFVSVIAVFVLYNFLTWHLYTKKILSHNEQLHAGDLARMGYLSEFADPKVTKTTLTKKVIEAKHYDGSKVDMITIGDSFSQGGGGGLNNRYQDHIATILDMKVLNLANFQDKTRSYIETVYILANSGFLEQKGVKYILLESVQRKVVQRFVTDINKEFTASQKEIEDFYDFNSSIFKKKEKIENKGVNYVPATPFINNGNLKAVWYRLLYNFSDNAYISQVYKTNLTENLFSIGDKTLLFYQNDLSRIHINTEENLKVVNKNLNELADFLEKYDIKLVFMPAPNKYDLYSSYIENNPYPKDMFFDHLRKLEKKYIFIDTKKILLKKLENGVKDVYYIDDTHWSGIASKAVAKEIKALIEEAK